MSLCRLSICTFFLCLMMVSAKAQAEATSSSGINLELNTTEDIGGACRLTFVAQNQIGQDISKVVFETVIFDDSGSVMLLSLFDFRELPTGTPRVRQFDVPNTTCNTLGRVLINGVNTCTVHGADGEACKPALSVSSKIGLELIG